MPLLPKTYPTTRLIALSIGALLLLIIMLLNLPIAGLFAQLQENELARVVLTRKKLVVAVGGLLALGIAVWLVVRRQLKLLLACIGIVLIAATTYGVSKFQENYPRADFFSAQRYKDNIAILLGKDTLLSEYAPTPTLKLNRKMVPRAAYPAIDVHFHLESLPPAFTPERLVKAMDEAGIAKIVNLGGVEGTFERFAETYYAKYPDRFIMFVKPDPNALSHENGIEKDVEWIKKAARMGARGIKENKSFGLGQRDAAGKLIPVDDSRLDPIWELAGKLGMPVLIHTGEPPAFWQPVNAQNERYPELLKFPNWSLYGKDVPSLEELKQQRERLLAHHPGTNFIGAHFGMNPEDLTYVGYLLDKFPNYYVDISSVVQELGRQPYSARRFFIKYQDRILFGTDGGFGHALDGDGWTPERMYRSYFEFLETDNEYIQYPMQDVSKQGNWRIYGIELPAEVLEKIYVRNAEKLIPPEATIRERLAAQ